MKFVLLMAAAAGKEKSFLDKVRDFNWDFTFIVDWFADLALYYYDQIGWTAWIFIAITLWLLLMVNDVTAHMMSLVTARVINTVFMVTVGAAALLVAWLARVIPLTILARIRDTLRYIAGARKDDT